MPNESASIRAIQLARLVFESVYGNVGILKFSIEKLTPTNGHGGEESKTWDVVCSFYEALTSTEKATFKAKIDLTTNTVDIEKLSGNPTPQSNELVNSKFRVTKDAKTDEGKSEEKDETTKQ